MQTKSKTWQTALETNAADWTDYTVTAIGWIKWAAVLIG